MFKIDHHLHTARHSPDSQLDPDDLAASARQAGLDGVVITEHDHQWESGELAELNARAGGLLVLSGAEVSAIEGHFLVYGLPDLAESPPGITLANLLRVVRRHGAAIIAAHPFRWGQDFDAIVDAHGASFDALELVSNNVTAETRALTQRLLARTPMNISGSSDAHQAAVIGRYCSTFPGPIASMGDFVDAIRRGLGRPTAGPGATLQV